MIYVITAGTKGLGRELAIKLAKTGNIIWALYNSDHQSADNFRQFIKQNSLPVSVAQVDVLDLKQIATFCETCLKDVSQPLGLIHAASTHFELLPAQQWTEELLEKLWQVNVLGFFSLAKLMFPLMKKNKGSLLVGILSETIAGDKPSKGFFGYNIAKIAMDGMLRSLSVEWEKAGIKTLSILPGSMDSGIFNRWPDHIQNMVAPKKPMSTEAAAEKMSAVISNYESIESGGRSVVSE
jgi:3-oxoacyl-[acyl-carrier protein] reductase